MKKIYLVFLYLSFFSLHNKLFAQAININGENYITLNDNRFKNVKVAFSKVEGDWFNNSADAHSCIILYGNYEGRKLQLNIEWDGKGDSHELNSETREIMRGGEFVLSMPDKDVYGDGLNAYPNSDQKVVVTVSRMDDLNLAASFKGIVPDNDASMKVEGLISIHRNAAPRVKTLSYKTFDNTVYDKFFGAQARSASEAEVNFDQDVKQSIHHAFAPVIDKFSSNEWMVESETEQIPLTSAERGTEKSAMTISYNMKLKLPENSSIVQQYLGKDKELRDKLLAGADPKIYLVKLDETDQEMLAATHVNIDININNSEFSVNSFKNNSKISKLPNGAWYIQTYHTQSRNGGDETASADAAFILIGDWKQPAIEKQDEGIRIFSHTNISNADHKLKMQNMVIRLDCSEEMATQIINTIDFEKLQSLLKNGSAF
jgi:hypothetical protein